MKDLTDEQIWEAYFKVEVGSAIRCFRSIIAADRALNAPTHHTFYVDGEAVSPEKYIDWLGEELTRVKNAALPPMKFYGGSTEEGEQHEVKSAYVDGWNDCRRETTKMGGGL